MIKKADIPNDTVTYAKMQNASADNVVLGNISGAGEPLKELTASEVAGIVDGELLIDEDDFASDSDTKAPTQQSTKAYVDGAVVQPDVVLIDTQTASSSASINFTTLSTTYKFFKVVILSAVPSTDVVSLGMRTSTDGGSTWDSGVSDYDYTRVIGQSTTTQTVSGSLSYGLLHASSLGTASNEVMHAEITLFNPSQPEHTFYRSEATLSDRSSATLTWSSAVGRRTAASDVDAIQFIMSSGNIASGTFKLYGYK